MISCQYYAAGDVIEHEHRHYNDDLILIKKIAQIAMQTGGKWSGEVDCIDGLMQERRNSNALAMELRRSCTKLWICG